MRTTTSWKRGALKTPGVFALALIAGVLATPERTAAQSAKPTPTFTKDIAPILQRSCQQCHRPGALAPMSLLTYEDARPWARLIKNRVVSRHMPPWHIDKNVGIQKFKDDPSLTDDQIATIAAWVDGGVARGNPVDMPPPRQFEDADVWNIGKPDLIVEIPKEYVVPGDAPDKWIDSFAPTGLTEDRYIKAIQSMPAPGARKVVHHITTTVLQTLDGEDKLLSGIGDDVREPEEQFLNEYGMGKNGDILPDGTGRVLKAGSVIKFNVHYHASGEETRDRSRIGIVLYPKGYVPKFHQVTRGIARPQDLIDIPAGAENARVDGYHRFDKPVRITAVQAHMHNRGKRMCMEAILPTSLPSQQNQAGPRNVETLSCFNFDFAWHKVYNYADDVAPLLPAGTVLHVIGWHDNSIRNRNNPDPRNWVGAGSRTNDEMSFAWTTWTNLTEEEYKKMVEERQAKAAN